MKEKVIVVSLAFITVVFVFLFATKGYSLLNTISQDYYSERSAQ